MLVILESKLIKKIDLLPFKGLAEIQMFSDECLLKGNKSIILSLSHFLFPPQKKPQTPLRIYGFVVPQGLEPWTY